MSEKTSHAPRRTIVPASATSVVLVGASASPTVYDEFIPAGGAYEMPSPVYQGQIQDIWSRASGSAYISERIG